MAQPHDAEITRLLEQAIQSGNAAGLLPGTQEEMEQTVLRDLQDPTKGLDRDPKDLSEEATVYYMTLQGLRQILASQAAAPADRSSTLPPNVVPIDSARDAAPAEGEEKPRAEEDASPNPLAEPYFDAVLRLLSEAPAGRIGLRPIEEVELGGPDMGPEWSQFREDISVHLIGPLMRLAGLTSIHLRPYLYDPRADVHTEATSSEEARAWVRQTVHSFLSRT